MVAGRARFAGTVTDLAGVAAGQVWVDDARDPRAPAAWRPSGWAVAAALRARGLTSPSWLAGTGLVGGAMLLHGLPDRYAMAVNQTWGPPWQAAQLRWAALLLLALVVMAAEAGSEP